MSRVCTHVLTLMLALGLAGSIAQAAPPRESVDEPGLPARQPPREVTVLVHDGLIGSHEPAYASGHIVVQFAPSVSTAMKSHLTRSLGGREYVPAQFGDFGRVRVEPGQNPADLVRRFRANPEVEIAELDPIVWPHGRAIATRVHRPGAVEVRNRDARQMPDTTSQVSHAPAASNAQVTPAQADPHRSLQWYLGKIRLQEAEGLNATRGSGAVVAVIDSGVLFGSGGNCVNDFPQGRGPDLGGVSFVQGIDLVDRGTPPFDEGNADQPGQRRFGHGTAVAAQIAAAVDNDIGGRGIAPSVSIMPIRVFPRFGGTPDSIIAEAIRYAADHGADVINLSLGGEGSSQVMAQAVRFAHDRGVVLVASSGNEADDRPNAPVNFPAAFPEVIAVGATNFFDSRASYSNLGPELDLTAPVGDTGDEVGSPVSGIPLLDAAWLATFLTDPLECGFGYFFGTSFAAPQVSAAAALLKAVGVQDPETIQTLLQNGARDLGAQGFDNETGHGLLDLFEAHEGFGFSFE